MQFYGGDPQKGFQDQASQQPQGADYHKKKAEIEAKQKQMADDQQAISDAEDELRKVRRRSRMGALAKSQLRWNQCSSSKTSLSCAPCCARRWSGLVTLWKRLPTAPQRSTRVRARRYLLVLTDLKLPGALRN